MKYEASRRDKIVITLYIVCLIVLSYLGQNLPEPYGFCCALVGISSIFFVTRFFSKR